MSQPLSNLFSLKFQPKYPSTTAQKPKPNAKTMNDGMEALRHIATTSLFLQNEHSNLKDPMVPIIKEPDKHSGRLSHTINFNALEHICNFNWVFLFYLRIDAPLEMRKIDDLHVHDISDDDDGDDDDEVECFTVLEPIPSTSNLEHATNIDEWIQKDRPNKLVRSRAPINQKKLNNNTSNSNNINNITADTMETSLITIATTSSATQPLVHQPQTIAFASTSVFASTSKAHQQPSTSACIVLEPSLLIESSGIIFSTFA